MTDCNHRWSEIVDLQADSTDYYRECVDCGMRIPTAVHETSSDSASSTRSTSSCEIANASIEISSNADDVRQTVDELSKSLELSADE